MDAETLLALRMGFSLPFFVVMGLVADARATRRMDGRDWLWMVALGFSGYYLSSYLDFLGLRYITAALERLILFLYPTLVIVLSALFRAKPVGRRTLAALALCYCGIGLAVGHDLHVAGDARDVAIGGTLVFVSALSYAVPDGQRPGRRPAWCDARDRFRDERRVRAVHRPVLRAAARLRARSAVAGVCAGRGDGADVNGGAGVARVGGDPPPRRRAGVADGDAGPGRDDPSRLAAAR
ncbi:EamA domain-containing protein [Aromatoleum petrolei]|nr:EamA domain-containing protein [Aromatoleum petrolei]